MHTEDDINQKYSNQYVDLLAEQVGGRALSCSDEWFAECCNLVKPGRGVFKEGCFVSSGQWMDGWESRRSYARSERKASANDFDWCILRLGIHGVIRGFDVDTNHFKGNAAEYISIEAASVKTEVNENTQWTQLVSQSPTSAHCQNLFACDSNKVWTHLRLKMYPDGGIARFRVYGEARIVRENFIENELVDLASVMNGGRGVDASDHFFSSPSNLVMPGRGVNMGDGWETKRRRDEHNDWAIIELGLVGTLRKIIIDTAHFKGNYPDSFMLEAANISKGDAIENADWQTVIANTPLYADREHLFIEQIKVAAEAEFSHVKINIYPDGGISRLRILGFPNWEKA